MAGNKRLPASRGESDLGDVGILGHARSEGLVSLLGWEGTSGGWGGMTHVGSVVA